MLNSITIHAIRKTSSLPKPLKTLLLSLAVSDLTVRLLVHPLYIAHFAIDLVKTTENNTIQNNIGIAFAFIGIFLSYASFFFVLALTADRFLAVHLHLRYQEFVTHKRVVAVVISIMAFSLLLSSFPWWIPHDKLIIYSSIENFCLVLITILYCKISSTVRRHRNQIQSLQVQRDEGRNREMVANVTRLVKLALGTFYVYLVLLVCFLPRMCLTIALIISRPNTTTMHIFYYSWTMVLLNSSLNPLIYCWKMRHSTRCHQFNAKIFPFFIR